MVEKKLKEKSQLYVFLWKQNKYPNLGKLFVHNVLNAHSFNLWYFIYIMTFTYSYYRYKLINLWYHFLVFLCLTLPVCLCLSCLYLSFSMSIYTRLCLSVCFYLCLCCSVCLNVSVSIPIYPQLLQHVWHVSSNQYWFWPLFCCFVILYNLNIVFF